MLILSLELRAVLPVGKYCRLQGVGQLQTAVMLLRQAVTQRDMTETLPNGLVRMPAQSLGAPDSQTRWWLVVCNTSSKPENQAKDSLFPALPTDILVFRVRELQVSIFQTGAKELKRVS